MQMNAQNQMYPNGMYPQQGQPGSQMPAGNQPYNQFAFMSAKN